VVTIGEISRNYPRLYHMAAVNSWENIRRFGLLSTTNLLDLFEIQDEQRHRIEARHRPECVTIQHPIHGSAIVRDQKPMSDNRLLVLLEDNLTPSDWYLTLNRKVFFWLNIDRLNTLRGAKAYRDLRQTILTIDTRSLLEQHHEAVLLSPINSGCTFPSPARRGLDTFLPLSSYPFNQQKQRRGLKSAIVELAVTGAVPDIADHVLRVEENGGGTNAVVLFER